MVCRSNPASSVVIALARNDTWLDDAQVQSIFHTLRHDPISGSITPTRRGEMVATIFAHAETQIRSDSTFRPQRRAGLLRRLENSRAQTDGLANDTLSAMERLQASAHAAQLATETRLFEIAGRRGMSLREAQAEFVQLRVEAPGGRQARATREELADLGNIPSDPATRHALREMNNRPPVNPPVRLVQRWLPVTPAGGELTHLGISELSNRCELRHRNGEITAIQTGPAFADREGFAARSDATQTEVARLRADGRELSTDRAEATAFAVRCDDCGRFVGDRVHHCPARNARIIRTEQESMSDGSNLLRMAAITTISSAVDNATRPVQVPVAFRASDHTQVEGTIAVRPGGDVITAADRRTRQRLDVDDAGPGELSCTTCDASDSCRHVAEARRAIRRELAAAGRLTSDRAAQADRQTQLHTTFHTQSRVPALDDRTRPTDSATLNFRDEPEIFRAVIRDASPERDVPFMAENALSGYASGVRFGVELEFGVANYSDRQVIAARLYEEGITNSPRASGYHTAARNGYDTCFYTLENDSSVNGGELVTSIESDTPESWARLQAACEIIRSGGGTTAHAGSHTNISCPDFTAEHAWRLANLFRQHEDDLLRCGRTPGSIRDRGYNSPLGDPGPRWTDRYERALVNNPREAMINFNNAFGRRPEAARLEYRFPDASHHPGVIQAQIKLAAAMTNYVRDHDIPSGQHRSLGASQREGWTNRLMSSTSDEWEQRTRGIRTLISDLFDRDGDRQQMAVLWAHGRYQVR